MSAVRALVLRLAPLALLALPGPLPAQEGDFRLHPGEPIEIAAPVPDGGLVPATVEHWEPGWIAFRLEDGQVWTRRMHEVRELRVRREVPLRRRLWAGAVWGLFIGSSLGAISGPFASRAVEGEGSPWVAVGVTAAAGGALGMGVGALVGAAIRRSSWIHYLFRAPGSAR